MTLWKSLTLCKLRGDAAEEAHVGGALPDVPLDGELWLDRKKFQRTMSIVRR